jgi:membrane fusion protein, multidrug efflux system
VEFVVHVQHMVRSLLILVIAAAAAGCDSGAGAVEPEAPAGPPLVNVAAMRIVTSELTEQIELSGRIEPWVEVRVASELGGLAEEVAFEKGGRVEEGQVLARVGTDLHRAALDEAEAVLAGAEATYDRVRQLVERQAVPKQNAITATADYDTARARVAQHRLRLERSIVRAPITGTAVTREVEPGEVLAPGTTITTLHRLDRLKANVPLPENDVALFRTGSRTTLRVDAWPGRTFEGRIHYVAPSATGSTRTFPAEIAIENRDGALRPGMIARVILVRRAYPSAVVVPRDVLQERDQGPVAVVLEDDTARIRPVTLGAMQGDQVLVESGLQAGDWLIVSGHRGLVDGQRVQVVERRE